MKRQGLLVSDRWGLVAEWLMAERPLVFLCLAATVLLVMLVIGLHWHP